MTSDDNANLYIRPGSRAGQLFQRASRVMPAGNTRYTVFTPPHPFYVSHGHGCTVVDVEGQERIDFDNDFTALITGHANPAVVEAVVAQVRKGSAFAWPTESEVRLAEIITGRAPTVEAVRFANSGTEAVMHAVKAARAYTGRRKIARFEGAYHGAYDYVEVSLDPTPEVGGDPRAPRPVLYSPGSSPSILSEVVVLPFNDLEAVEAILEREKDSVAAVLVDPVPNRAGLMPPKPGFLRGLQGVTRRHGILLISDEVISFRLDYHGAQHHFGYEADLTTLGKIIGGGYAVGAIGGRAEVMAVFDPSKGKPKMPHGGTFTANPVTMVAGIANMEQLTPEVFDSLNELGETVRARLNDLFRRTGFEAQASGYGSLFKIVLNSRPLVDYRSSLIPPERKPLAEDLYKGLLARGVALANNLLGSISTPMAVKEIDHLVGAVEDWVHEKGY